jgi:hypothetical protein
MVMTTAYTYRLLAGFGDATSAEVGDWCEFAILWDGDAATMPGWEQPSQSAGYHIPGSDTNIIFLMGLGELRRSFRVLCSSKTAYAALCGLQQYEGTLRVPATMNELDIATEANYSGQIVADIPDVVLEGLSGVRVSVDGTVEATAAFWRSGRT